MRRSGIAWEVNNKKYSPGKLFLIYFNLGQIDSAKQTILYRLLPLRSRVKLFKAGLKVTLALLKIQKRV